MKKILVLIISFFLTIQVYSQAYKNDYTEEHVLKYAHFTVSERLHLLRDLLCPSNIEEAEKFYHHEFGLYRHISLNSEIIRVYGGALKEKTLASLRNMSMASIALDSSSTEYFIYNQYADSFSVFGWLTHSLGEGCNGLALASAYSFEDSHNATKILKYAQDQSWDKQKLKFICIYYSFYCLFFTYEEELYVAYKGAIMSAHEFTNNVRYSNEFEELLREP